MFANFELYEDVLIKLPPPRRHNRTVTGCLQCRRRKRKCDEQRPVCKSCLKYGSDCSLAQGSSSPEKSCSPSASRHSSPQATQTTSMAKSSHTTQMKLTSNKPPFLPTPIAFSQKERLSNASGPGSTLSVSLDKREQAEEIIQRLFTLRSTLPLPLWKTIESPFSKLFNQPEEQRGLQSLMTRFHPMVTLSYANPDRSILANGLPLAFEYRSIRTGFIACGLALIFRLSGEPADQEAALKYYSETVNTIKNDLMSLPTEPNLAAVLLLHLFEDICSDSIHRKQVHLKGAQTLISTAIKSEKPWSSHMALLLEAYIYHTVTSGILSDLTWPSTLPDDHIFDLLQKLREASEKVLPGPLWASGAILGVSHDLFDIAFRISQLRKRLPLQADDQVKANQLQHQLKNWCMLTSSENGTFHHPPHEMVLTAELYRLACQVLLAKIINPALTSSHQYTRDIIQKSVNLMKQMSIANFDTFVLHWPVIILGSGAITSEEKHVFRSSYEREINGGGFGYLKTVANILNHAWSFDDELDRQIGLDAFVYKEYDDSNVSDV